MPRTLVRPNKPCANIGFRLDADTHQELVERAARLKVGKHELARVYVLQLLQEEQERIALHAAVAGLHRMLVQQREDFLLAVEALLASAGHASAEQARAWAQTNSVK